MFRFSLPIQLRFRDTDAMGHVNNAVFLTFFEMGRVGYFRALGYRYEPGTPGATQFPFILAEVSCRFASPLHLGETPVVALRCTHLGTKSFRFEYRITTQASGRAVASGTSAQVCYDYAEQRSVPIPEDLRRCILDWEQDPALGTASAPLA